MLQSNNQKHWINGNVSYVFKHTSSALDNNKKSENNKKLFFFSLPPGNVDCFLRQLQTNATNGGKEVDEVVDGEESPIQSVIVTLNLPLLTCFQQIISQGVFL